MIPLVLYELSLLYFHAATGKPVNGTARSLYNKYFFEGDIVPNPDRNAVIDKTDLWPNGVIVYRANPSVGCPDSNECWILNQAIYQYQENTCVRFKEWSGERDYVDIFHNADKSECWSSVGRARGRQMLSLGQDCWYLGIVMHELGHAVGFYHEMNRPDRDDWVTIYWGNIMPDHSSSFLQYAWGTVDLLGEQFDHRSVMMYDEYAFSKDGVSPTIRLKHWGHIAPLWEKERLSASDVRRIQKLYNC